MDPSFRFDDFAFEPVSCIQPERGPSGEIRDFTPHVTFKDTRALKLLPGGDGPFCKFSISSQWQGRPGVYVFLVDGALVYVGECECLAKRVNQGYGCIAPRNCFLGGQSTNIRINRLIRDAILRGRRVELAFCCTESRKRVESEMINRLSPPWNRAAPRLRGLAVMAAKESVNGPARFPRVPKGSAPTCREQILKAARAIVREKRRNELTVPEIVDHLRNAGANCPESTIRTHVISRCCRNAPKNHAVTYGDFERIARGLYRMA
jgi:hypothetical protein